MRSRVFTSSRCQNRYPGARISIKWWTTMSSSIRGGPSKLDSSGSSRDDGIFQRIGLVIDRCVHPVPIITSSIDTTTRIPHWRHPESVLCRSKPIIEGRGESPSITSRFGFGKTLLVDRSRSTFPARRSIPRQRWSSGCHMGGAASSACARLPFGIAVPGPSFA